MKTETLYKLDRILTKVDDAQTNAMVFCVSILGTIVALPFVLVYEGCKSVGRRMNGLVRDKSTGDWITKEQQARKERNKRIANRELPLTIDNHVTPNKDKVFFFFEKRKLVFPYSQLVYVETVRCEKIRRFMEEDAEWLDTWTRWYGFEIVEYAAEDIKEGMFYPQDFAMFRHGFLCNSGRLNEDKESGISGCVYRYYEIEPDSKNSIREQMESMIREIYKVYNL